MNPEFLHDMRQPLTAIQNFTRACIIELRRHPDGGEKVCGWLEYANREARRASNILKQANVQGQSANCPPEPTDIRHSIENVIDGLRRESGISAGVLHSKPDREPYLLLGDSALLDPVFRDLLVSVIGSRSRADETARTSSIAIGRENTDLVLDIGLGAPVSGSVGVDNDAGATERECSATIVGLSACEAIIERHGGSLTLWKRQDGTVRVRVRLPAYQLNGGTA